MAGESADDVAQRQREKAARLTRSAELWEQGAVGERRTASVLDELAPFGYVTLHDLKWPGRPRANIDHVLVGPSGVYVIDSKNWTGRIVVAQGTVLQNRRRRDAAITSCGEAALALIRILNTDVMPVLCLVRDEEITGRAHDVRVCTTSNLRRLVLSRPAILSVDQVRWVTDVLRQEVPAAVGQRPVTPKVPRRSRPATASTTPASRKVIVRKQKRQRKRSFRAGALGAILISGLGYYMVSELPRPDGQSLGPVLGAQEDHPRVPTKEFGKPYVLAGNGAEVVITVGRPVNTRSMRPGAYVTRGTRLVGVRVTLRNRGKQAWHAPTLLRWGAEDSLGNRASMWVMPDDVSNGSRLPSVRAVWPGRPKSGVLVFEVPRGQQLEAISMATEANGEVAAVWSRTG